MPDTCGSFVFYILLQKMLQNYFIILFEIFLWKSIRQIRQTFAFEHKINKLDKELYTHFWIIYLYFVDTCSDTIIANKILNLVWIVFNFKATKLRFIIIIHTETDISSEFLLIFIYQDLIHTPHLLQCLVNYLVNNHLWI